MKWPRVFEVLYRALAFSFFATAILTADNWFLKFFGCLCAAFFWALADQDADRA